MYFFIRICSGISFITPKSSGCVSPQNLGLILKMPYVEQLRTKDDADIARELWRPSAPESTRIHRFKSRVNHKYGLALRDYHDLWRWSVDEPARFWEETWHFTGVKSRRPYEKVFCCLQSRLFFIHYGCILYTDCYYYY